MKKSLIALAALAVVSAASAQSSVTISGYVDRGYTSVDNTDLTKKLNTLSSSAGTTSIFVKGTEDLGGGNVAGFSVETDWTELDGNTQKSSYSAAQNAGFANGESFISLANANIGTLKLGAVNSFMTPAVTGVAAPSFSTGVGSTFSSNFSIFNGIGTGVTGNGGVGILATNSAPVAAAAAVPGTVVTTSGSTVYTAPVAAVAAVVAKGTTGARDIRIGNTIQYVSPVFSGFSAGIGYAQQNNNVTAQTKGAVETAGITGATPAGGNANTVGMTEFALNYANGPVKVIFDTIQYKVGSYGTAQTTGTAATGSTVSAPLALNGDQTSRHNLLAASYALLPELTVNVGFGSFSSSNDLSKGNSVQAGATYVIGAIDLMANYAKVNDSSALNIDRKMFGLGANYNLSKTARVYARYDDINYASNQAAYAGSVQKRTAIGVSKSF